ncbi:hypothetical protein Mpet_1447 [Methanolacinia petrolearia DSM 11571]|uniref:Dit-like phage tail protein N-terminal domain-containing protein n=1 Tax=Methanolacinia petrolearia (strain DSM 11571 / OCM 486 / SEBR 4847) TaxID=679926 RepID=E1RFH6_METP4|nr:hypothetical protein [Methanolacinia petrolearia]ADN36206.1 hypothetical protein Mpet_1447 [Methanolacinia petrolearia DSM 11571]
MATEDIVLIYDNVRTVLETVSEVSYSDSLEVPQHKTAAQYSISDHIIRNPVSVTLKMTVLKDDIDTLVSLKNQKKRLKFISETRVVDTVVISALNYSEGTSINTCSATLKLQEVITAKVESASESLEILTAKPEESVTASGSSSSPEEKTTTTDGITEIIENGGTVEGMLG